MFPCPEIRKSRSPLSPLPPVHPPSVKRSDGEFWMHRTFDVRRSAFRIPHSAFRIGMGTFLLSAVRASCPEVLDNPIMNIIRTFAFALVTVPVTALSFWWTALPAAGAELTLRVSDKPPPKELDGAVAKSLQNKSVQLLAGDKPVFEFWFVSELPLTQKPASLAKALDAVKQTTLLGAVAVPAAQRDYRDDEIAAGVYTMRLALQPNDGNHLGSSEFGWFAALVPAKVDTKLDAFTDYKALVKASSKQTSTDHPVILSLRPAASADGDLPKLQEPAPEHKSVRLKLPAKAGTESTELVFELVYEGKGHK